jgi:hypothetical protein
MVPNGEGAQENAPDDKPDGGLSEQPGQALDPLVGGVQTGHDRLGVVEKPLGRLDRRFHVLEPVRRVHVDHSRTVWFFGCLRHRDESGGRSNHALACDAGYGSGVQEVADRLGAVLGVVHEQKRTGARHHLEPGVGDARGQDAAVHRRHNAVGAAGQHERGSTHAVELGQAGPSHAGHQLAGVAPDGRGTGAAGLRGERQHRVP